MSLRIFKTTEDAARFAGLVDGDGSLIAQIKPNKTFHLGFQLQCTLQVTQATIRRALLKEVLKEIGDGKIRDRGSEPVSDYVLTKRNLIGDVVRDIIPYLRKDVKQRQAVIMLEIIELMQDPTFTRDPIKFLAICELTDELSLLNDSKKRTNTAESVRKSFRSKGYNV